MHTVYDLMSEFPEMDVAGACGRAYFSRNGRAMVRGFSLFQWFLGGQDSIVASACQSNLAELSHVVNRPQEFNDNLIQ